MPRNTESDLKRGSLTLVWLIGWGVLLWHIHRPWWLLGGWIEPRIFWAERAALYFSPLFGFLFADWRRRRRLARGTEGKRSSPILPAMVSLMLMLVIRSLGGAEILGVATTALCGLTAGGLTAHWEILLRRELPELRPWERCPGKKDGPQW